MGSADAIKQVIQIIHADKERKYIVVSAPGKTENEAKITDQLIALADEYLAKGTMRGFSKIRDRFVSIAKGLHVEAKLKPVLEATRVEMQQIKTKDFIVSRGEYLMGRLLSYALDFPFIDSRNLVRFTKNKLDYGTTNRLMREVLKKNPYVVISGFYGSDEQGNIKVLSRGGGDVTGALVARGVEATIYENWTDVNGFLAADPHIIDNPKQIKSITYKELRVLSFMGASVLHSEAYFPVAKKGIPIQIRNTFNPDHPGTLIVPSIENHGKTEITGIAGLKDFTLVVVEKQLMSDLVGFDRKILRIAEKLDINVEHFPSGTDTFSMMIESKYLKGDQLSTLVNSIKKQLKPDLVEVFEHISLISIVGRNLMSHNQNMFRFFSALVNANITLKMIDYGSNGVNIVIGVNDEDYAYAIQAIYQEFVEKELS
jgi:aspartate kinase